MRLVNLIEFWTVIALFLSSTDNQDGLCMGNRGFGFEGLKQIKMASALETEGLMLTDVSFCQNQLLYFLDNSVFVSL